MGDLPKPGRSLRAPQWHDLKREAISGLTSNRRPGGSSGTPRSTQSMAC
jgi:hypothetical protein